MLFRLRDVSALLAALALGACSDGGAPGEDPASQARVVELPPLTEPDLGSLPRERVTLALPWSESVVSRDPNPVAARATLHAVEITEEAGFDRARFEFGDDADFPGYRIVWNDTTNAKCADEDAPDLGEGRTLLIRFNPARAHEDDGARTVAERARRPDFPTLATARQLCDDADGLVWALGAVDSTRYRVVELSGPPSLVVDLLHPGGAPAAAAATDSAPAAPR